MVYNRSTNKRGYTILTNNNLGICIQNGIPTIWDINETCIGMHWEYYIGKYWGYNGKPTIMEMCSWYFVENVQFQWVLEGDVEGK